MICTDQEIEAKLAADNVEIAEFVKWIAKLEPVESKIVKDSPDDYYKGDVSTSVVRHRGVPGDHELTVKRRKSGSSTRDREEIDLRFAKTTTHREVGQFLRATGYQKVFQLMKEAYIYWVKPTPNITLVYVIYDVWDTEEGSKSSKRYIEVEAEKGSKVTPDTAKRYVREAVTEMQAKFRLGEPLNESLYEIFSGDRYSSV